MEIKADVNAVLVGRILAAVVILMGFAYSVKAGTSSFGGGFWVFLSAFTMPLALGFIVIVLSEILKVVRKDN